jgi:hypothetical protein
VGVAGRLKKRSSPAIKAGLSGRQKQRIGQQYTRTAGMWERRYAEVARRQFENERERLLKVLDGEKSRKQAPSISWDEVSMGWQQVYAQAGDEWRNAFVPLMQGTIEDQCSQYSAAFGMAFDVRLLYAEQWFDEYTMTFAEGVIGTSERELADLLQTAQREGWSIPDMEGAIGDLFDGWMDGRPPSRVADWVGERQPRWRRELIARTETIRSSGAGINKLFGQWGVEYKEWLTTQDDRTCPWCREMNGKMIPTNGTFWEQGSKMTLQVGGKLQSLSFGYGKVDFPPLHPACRCCLLPYKPEWENVGVRPLGGKPVATPSASQQTVSRMSQLENAEGEIVGQSYETAVVVDNNGNIILRKDGGKSVVEFSQAELDAMKGATLTHNHPSGNSFSPSDVNLLLRTNATEIRAVGTSEGTRYVYIMRPQSEAYQNVDIVMDRVRNSEASVKTVFRQKIAAGEMSIDEANARHFHEVWKRVDKTFGGGLGYRREEW